MTDSTNNRHRAVPSWRRPLLLLLLVGWCCVGWPRGGTALAPPPPLTNQDVVALIQAGVPPEVIVEKIKASKTNFDTSTAAIIALKGAGASAEIIRIMVNPAASPDGGTRVLSPWTNPNAPAPCQAPGGAGPVPWLSGASPAMWLIDPDSGNRTEINYERGTLKHVGFYGIGAQLLELHPIRATLRVGPRAQFASCLNPSDAPLVRFSLDRGSNERNTSLGRYTPWNHSISISQEDLVPMRFEKTPDGYFKITPQEPMTAGEYGFVPQATAGFFALGERVYSFGVD